MRLGIDASNIRAGGGLTHLAELMRAANPVDFGIERVIVWGGRQTLSHLPERSWLQPSHDPLLDGSATQRVLWQQTRLTALATRNCDILFFPGGRYTGGFKPFVAMSQNFLPFDPEERRRYGLSLTRLRLHLLERGQTTTFRNAAGMIFLTETVSREIKRRTGPLQGEVRIIPHGLTEIFRSQPRSQRALSSYSSTRPFKWLYVSIVDVYKHQWEVAKAIASLRQQGLPVALDMIGPAYPAALRHLKQVIEGIDPDNTFINYLGAVPHRELPGYYHQADGFAFASSCESLPNVLVEAMAGGLPIACAARGPMPEVLGEEGVYFDPEQPENIASALRRLMEDADLRERCAWSAYERAQSFSWERCARETFSLLADVAQTSCRNVA
ncbi:MAG TPA: glycosyltransferase family 1 protein [Pyrinomonadaceae bacterium]|jgi:glycosyltransferase involved in cell wall biosynthesis|nr:glycosyltransferase family 1 protein [Pyrinomonadaceae bacterium]